MAIASIVLGSAYFYIMESSIPKDTNCSYSASVMTDILAFVVGGYVSYVGYNTGNRLLFVFGNAIVVEHVWQMFWFRAWIPTPLQ